MKGKLIVTQLNNQQPSLSLKKRGNEELPINDSSFQKSKKIKKNHQSKNIEQPLIEKVNKLSPNKIPHQQIFIKPQKSKKHSLKHLAICFPDSILQLPQTSSLRAYFISQVARISSIFKVDQIIILKDHSYTPKSENFNPCQYLARNLQYLETPQYLRKYLFKMHPDLQNAGLMNPIQSMHHLKATQLSQYRQGVVLDRPTKKGYGSWVDVGLKQQARISELLLPQTRVTVKLRDYQNIDAVFYEGQAISRKTPKQQKGLYWGYNVRIAKNIKDLIQNGQSNYSLKILCNHKKIQSQLPQLLDFTNLYLSQQSLMIFFSGTDDLQTLIEKDNKSKITAQEAISMFDYCIGFGSLGVKQLRLEEQIFMTLVKLSEFVQ